MPTVQKFDRNMIERYLKSRSWKYLIDSDGDYRVEFAMDDEAGCELTVWLIMGGPNKEIYDCMIWSSRRVKKEEWGKAILMCNDWNKQKRWPKAYVYVRDRNTDTVGDIRLEQQMDLETGIHQELFDDFTSTIISGAHAFWKWATKEQGF